MRCLIFFVAYFIYIFILSSSNIHTVEHLTNEVRDSLPSQVCNYLDNLPKIDRALTTQGHLHKSMAIIDYLLKYYPTKKGAAQTIDNLIGTDLLADQILRFITQNKRILMYFPAFPFKSLNTKRKVLSSKPDMAELVAILTLNHVCCEIGSIYNQGAMIVVISDGVAFRDLFPISDEEYEDYHENLKLLFAPFERNLSLVLPSASAYMQFIRTNRNVPISPDTDKIRFLSIFAREEMRCTKYDKWKKQKPEIAKNLGYYLAISSDRFQRFLNQHPRTHDSIRLSVHEHEDISKKLSISLVYGSRGTPWHGVLVMTEHNVYLDHIRKIPNIKLTNLPLFTDKRYYDLIRCDESFILIKEWTPNLIHSLLCHNSKQVYCFHGSLFTCVYAPYAIIPKTFIQR